MRKLFLLLLVLPLLLSCDNQIEHTVSDYEKERIRQTIADSRWFFCEHYREPMFRLYDFKIINTSFENWEFYELLKALGGDESVETMRQHFTRQIFSVLGVADGFIDSHCYIIHLNSRFEIIWVAVPPVCP